jgi:ankyrin repeat protein
LLIACKNEKPQIAKLLIEHGADVNASNNQGRYVRANRRAIA